MTEFEVTLFCFVLKGLDRKIIFVWTSFSKIMHHNLFFMINLDSTLPILISKIAIKYTCILNIGRETIFLADVLFKKISLSTHGTVD